MKILRMGTDAPIGATDDAAAWLTSQGYRRERTVAVTVAPDRVVLEVWRRSGADNPLALYHPLIPDTRATDSIYLCANAAELERLISAAQMLIAATLPLVQMQRQFRPARRRSPN